MLKSLKSFQSFIPNQSQLEYYKMNDCDVELLPLVSIIIYKSKKISKKDKRINAYPKRINGYPKRIKRIKRISFSDTKRIKNIRKGYKKDIKYPKRIQKG